MSDGDCPFCRPAELEIVAANDLAFAVRDKFPVRPGHLLIVPRRHCADLFEATGTEREAIYALAATCRDRIAADDPTVGGFNVGSNVGEAAGQKIFHAHLHLIPRRAGEGEVPAATPTQDLARRT